ncbi:IS110 family transposase [Spirochaetia bacterium]|nr:IS110 family transposase [Spirochaetia bacterium]
MQFIGIDLHTNKFTCCYRDERSADKRTETFDLNEAGLAAFYGTLAADTHILVEATITTFSFVRLFKDRVKEAIIANTYELKQISLARTNTDKLDADKLCRLIKMQVLSGERTACPVTLAPPEIQELRSLFSTYRLYKKQNAQLKNRIHSLLKEQLYGFTREELFDKRSRARIRGLPPGTAVNFQVNQLLDPPPRERVPERDEADVEALKEQVLVHAAPYMREIGILTSMKGISVFTAIAIIADVIEVSRFKNSKHFTSYLRSAPKVSNSNTSTSIRGTNKQGRKLAAALLTQSLNHVLDSSLKLRRWYERLCEYKKAGLVRTGLRRRVLAELYQMLKKGEYHYARDAKKHEAKLAAYKKLLKSQTLLQKSA